MTFQCGIKRGGRILGLEVIGLRRHGLLLDGGASSAIPDTRHLPEKAKCKRGRPFGTAP